MTFLHRTSCEVNGSYRQGKSSCRKYKYSQAKHGAVSAYHLKSFSDIFLKKCTICCDHGV